MTRTTNIIISFFSKFKTVEVDSFLFLFIAIFIPMYDFAFCTFHEFMSLSRFCNKNVICDNPEFVNNQKFKKNSAHVH